MSKDDLIYKFLKQNSDIMSEIDQVIARYVPNFQKKGFDQGDFFVLHKFIAAALIIDCYEIECFVVDNKEKTNTSKNDKTKREKFLMKLDRKLAGAFFKDFRDKIAIEFFERRKISRNDLQRIDTNSQEGL